MAYESGPPKQALPLGAGPAWRQLSTSWHAGGFSDKRFRQVVAVDRPRVAASTLLCWCAVAWLEEATWAVDLKLVQLSHHTGSIGLQQCTHLLQHLQGNRQQDPATRDNLFHNVGPQQTVAKQVLLWLLAAEGPSKYMTPNPAVQGC